MMKLRRYLEGDMDVLTRVGVAAFGGRISDWEQYFDPAQNARLDLEQVHVIEEDGEVRASATVLPLESFVEGVPRPMGGISAVMVHPAYRRRGYAGELMRAVLRDMRERDVAVYQRGGEVEGYIIYKISGWQEQDPRRTLRVDEFVAATPRAREAILSFMAGFDPLLYVHGIKLATSRGEPLHPYLRSSYVKASIDPDQMLRLVDVETALGYLELAPEEPLVLDIRDDVIPENQGEYTMGYGKVVRGAETRQSVSLDVRQLAQLYAGYLPVEDLARHDLIQASSPEALHLLEALFPLRDPWLSGPD